jgi:hypothetical protein
MIRDFGLAKYFSGKGINSLSFTIRLSSFIHPDDASNAQRLDKYNKKC